MVYGGYYLTQMLIGTACKESVTYERAEVTNVGTTVLHGAADAWRSRAVILVEKQTFLLLQYQLLSPPLMRYQRRNSRGG